MQNRIDGVCTKGLFFVCCSQRALQGEEAVISVISWRTGRTDRVCRTAKCADTRATVNLEDELFSMRCQWCELMVKTAFGNAPDARARLVPGACVTDSNGLHDRMQHTVITP